MQKQRTDLLSDQISLKEKLSNSRQTNRTKRVEGKERNGRANGGKEAREKGLKRRERGRERGRKISQGRRKEGRGMGLRRWERGWEGCI